MANREIPESGIRIVELQEITLPEQAIALLTKAVVDAVCEIERKGLPLTVTMPPVEYFELSASGQLSYVCSLGQLFAKIEITSDLWQWRQD